MRVSHPKLQLCVFNLYVDFTLSQRTDFLTLCSFPCCLFFELFCPEEERWKHMNSSASQFLRWSQHLMFRQNLKFRFAQLPTVSRDEHTFCFARYIASAQNLLHGNMEERKGCPSECKSTPLSRMKMVNTRNTCILQAARSKCSRYDVVLVLLSTRLRHKNVQFLSCVEMMQIVE